MKIIYSFAILFCVIALNFSARYDNYKVYRITQAPNEQIEIIPHLKKINIRVNVWKCTKLINKNKTADVLVAPHFETQIQEVLKNANLAYNVIIDNLQTLIDSTKPKAKIRQEFGWEDYYTLDEIYNWMRSLAKKYNHVTELNVGKSYEGRDIKGIKVSFKRENKGVFIEGGIHAREWISPATVTYILNKIVTSNNSAVREMAENYDWYIFPCVNPDGYEYTHTTDRLWRMTRKPYGPCFGADPNRNWGYHWNGSRLIQIIKSDGITSILLIEGANTSNNTCDETYAGPYPFSEPEMMSLSRYISRIHKDLVGYISIHSYGQLLLIPYGYTATHLDNFSDLLKIGNKAIKSLAKRYGTQFIVGNMAETIYYVSGISVDWVKANFHIPITYTYELRDTGKHGFVLPAEQIIPSGQELLDSLVAMMKEAKKIGY